MHSEIATDLRAETKRILARHYGGIPDAIAAIKISTVARIDAYVTHAEDRAAACTCERVPGFQIDVRRHNGPLDAQFTLARFKRMAAEEGRA
jgi:hypothetical protein